jgi:hypothetical protein
VDRRTGNHGGERRGGGMGRGGDERRVRRGSSAAGEMPYSTSIADAARLLLGHVGTHRPGDRHHHDPRLVAVTGTPGKPGPPLSVSGAWCALLTEPSSAVPRRSSPNGVWTACCSAKRSKGSGSTSWSTRRSRRPWRSRRSTPRWGRSELLRNVPADRTPSTRLRIYTRTLRV